MSLKEAYPELYYELRHVLIKPPYTVFLIGFVVGVFRDTNFCCVNIQFLVAYSISRFNNRTCCLQRFSLQALLLLIIFLFIFTFRFHWYRIRSNPIIWTPSGVVKRSRFLFFFFYFCVCRSFCFKNPRNYL